MWMEMLPGRDMTIDFGNMEIICDFDKSSCNGVRRGTETQLCR